MTGAAKMGKVRSFIDPPARAENFHASQSPPRADEVRQELAKIVASTVFCDSLRLASFLRFVVDAALTGKSSQIKAYTVAIEALGRPASFDPQDDPIVRVEAGRLRRALAHYYAGAGIDDLMVIELLPGSYVPLFRRRTLSPSTGPRMRGEPGELANGGIADAIQALNEDQATLNAIFERLAQVRRQIEAMAAEIETAKKLLEQYNLASRPWY
jgi:hypothetical protein